MLTCDSVDLTSLAGTAAGLTWTWVNEVNRHDPEKRAYVSALVGVLPTLFKLYANIVLLDECFRLYLHRLGSHLYLSSKQATVYRCW